MEGIERISTTRQLRGSTQAAEYRSKALQNFEFLTAATGLGHKNIVKIIFRHHKRKYAPVGAKSLITWDSI